MPTNLNFIICSTKATSPGASHPHVTGVGISTNLEKYQKRMTVAEVRAAIRQGDRFYTVGDTSGKAALVELYDCPTCQVQTIRSAGDAVTDNNLDKMPGCN